ncbi:MAG: ribonuclease HI [Clostridia bacterium]|nr:ribonuclease HI [Clostridia bacterium]
MKRVTIYTDGACSGNPGLGGWGAVLMYGDKKLELNGGEEQTTNNRMELLAVIKGLQALKYACEVDLYSDSAYTVNAFTQGWLEGWKKNGWKKADGKPVLNDDLWKQLIELCNVHAVTFHKVKGHADNEWNNRCDFLARSAIEEIRAKIGFETSKNG